MDSFRLSLSDIAFAVLLWALLILKLGYTYGTSDHVELLPYVLFLHDHTLYAHDLFIQSLHASSPNERTVMANLLLPFVGHLSLAMFLFHFTNTVLMILGLVKLAGRFVKNKYVSCLIVLTSVLLLNDKGLGNVDLYTPSLEASDVSCMIIIWALNVFLDRKYIIASIIMAMATYVHVLEGMDVMVILCGVMLAKCLLDKEISFRQLAEFVAVYIGTVGIYLIFIFRAKTAGGSTIPPEELFQIMFVFRHPHHFIFSTFSLANKLLFGFYFLACLLYYPHMSRSVLYFVIIGTLGLIVYVLAVDVFHLVFVANFQWYKAVQWIKFFGITAAFSLIYRLLNPLIPRKTDILDYMTGAAGIIGGVLIFHMYSAGELDLGYKQHVEQEVLLCQKIKDITPKEAVFIQPFEMTALKFHGQRSSYVEFKAIAKNQRDLRKWYDRIGEVFGLDYHLDFGGFNLQQKADDHLDNLDPAQIDKLKSEGVTHIICKTEKYKETHKLILAENGYFVYQL